MELLIRFFLGMGVLILANGILHCIKVVCKDHGLPQKVSMPLQFTLFFSGAVISPENGCLSILFLFPVSCMAAMAYTDYHTRQIYVTFSRIMLVAGYGLLILLQQEFCLQGVLLYLFLVLVGVIVRAYTSGDAELFAALAPYIILISEQNGIEAGVFLVLYYWASLILWAANFLLYILVKNRLQKEFPMVPFLYAALLLIVGVENFL